MEEGEEALISLLIILIIHLKSRLADRNIVLSSILFVIISGFVLSVNYVFQNVFKRLDDVEFISFYFGGQIPIMSFQIAQVILYKCPFLVFPLFAMVFSMIIHF